MGIPAPAEYGRGNKERAVRMASADVVGLVYLAAAAPGAGPRRGLRAQSSQACARRSGRPGATVGAHRRHVAACRWSHEGFLGPAEKGASGVTGRIPARSPTPLSTR